MNQTGVSTIRAVSWDESDRFLIQQGDDTDHIWLLDLRQKHVFGPFSQHVWMKVGYWEDVPLDAQPDLSQYTFEGGTDNA